jgi:hypothetical protein
MEIQPLLPFGPPDKSTPSLPESPGDPNLTLLIDENTRLKSIIRDTAAHRQITDELQRAGAKSPELLFAAVKSDLQFADDNSVVNAAAIVDHLRRSYPAQFGADRPISIDAGAGMTSRQSLSKESLAKMSPAEIAKLDWDSVREVLAK